MLKLKTQNAVEHPAPKPMAEEKPRRVRLWIEPLEARVAPVNTNQASYGEAGPM
jgi:hypothetical protein